MAYEIESMGTDGNWNVDYIGDPNSFDTEAQAWDAVEGLERLGGEWTEAEYRVVVRRYVGTIDQLIANLTLRQQKGCVMANEPVECPECERDLGPGAIRCPTCSGGE